MTLMTGARRMLHRIRLNSSNKESQPYPVFLGVPCVKGFAGPGPKISNTGDTEEHRVGLPVNRRIFELPPLIARDAVHQE
jgi:hypothetical protein